MLQDLFHLDRKTEVFQDVFMMATAGNAGRQVQRGSSPPMKRKKVLPRASSPTVGRIKQPQSSNKLVNQAKTTKPNLQGGHPCYNWICNRAPCFDSTVCAVMTPASGSTKSQRRPRQHSFDPVDKPIEEDFRAWVLKYHSN